MSESLELVRNEKQFRSGLVFQAHRLVYHSTLGLIVIQKKKKNLELEGGFVVRHGEEVHLLGR